MQTAATSDADPRAAAGQALAAITAFLTSSAEISLAGDIDRQTPLLQGGVLDSLGFLQLMLFLGEKLEIEVLDEDFAPENFATVGTLVDFVVRKKQG